MRYIKLLKTNIVNRIWFFPSQKIRILEKEIKRLNGSNSQHKGNLLNSLVKEHLKAITYERKSKKESIEWHAVLRGKLKAEKKCCEKCASIYELTLDHIVPQSFLKDLGMVPEHDYNVNNFRLLCKKCNNDKGNHFDFTDERTEKLLQYYLGKRKWRK